MKRRDKHQWMLDRINDPYFIKAKKEGYKARSAYKLIEIQEKYKIIPSSGNVLDLGCAPGAWLQVLKKHTKALIYGIDLLPINTIKDINFLQDDIFSSNVDTFLYNKYFNLILSDLAPNCMGIKDIDHLRIMNLANKVLELIERYLIYLGSFCIKIFDGKELPDFLKQLRVLFDAVKIFKPKSSCAESNEIYLICQKFKNNKIS